MGKIRESDLERQVLHQLAGLGWVTVFGPDIAPGEPGAERSDYREVVLRGRLRRALSSLNPEVPGEALDEAVRVVGRAESAVVSSENWRCYELLTQGVAVEVRGSDGSLRTVRVRLADFADAGANDLLAVNQFTVAGARERRADVVLFVNGLPLVVMELKRPGDANATLRGAFNQIQTYIQQVPELFMWNQVCVISDGISARAGSFTAGWEHYAPWKTVDGEGVAPGSWPQIEVLVAGMLAPGVLLDLAGSFVAVSGDGAGTVKRVAKYHQYWAVRKAVGCTAGAVGRDGRAGVVWHTQGSGKSLEMLFYAGRVMRDPAMANPTLVVLTDRNDLDDQLFDTFASARPGAPLPEAPRQVDSRSELREALAGRQSGGVVFTTIQKFGLSAAERASGTAFPVLSERANVVVMVDEAHRSHYDFVDGFARHLRDGLPNAAFIGFTGTPIESADRSTRAVFGDYIDVYDLTQAIEDGATVKVFYEPRLARITLPAEALDELDDEFADAVSGTEEQTAERMKSRWARVEAVVGAEQRLAELAADIVAHWEARRDVLAGKAMVVAMSRRIAVALYDQIAALRPDWVTDDDATGRVKVVITGSAADEAWAQPHLRSKSAARALKARATDPGDELELVIVRDMWLTGFDSPAMHTMYVDKPMRGAPLMQAIARVNRTFRDKPSGLVVDYLGIAEDLRAALADYTDRDRAGQEMGQDLRAQAVPEMLAEHDIVCALLDGYDWRGVLAADDDRSYLRAVAGTVDHLLGFHPGDPADPCTPEKPCLKCRFTAHASRLRRLFAVCAPAEETAAIRDDVAFAEAVRAAIANIEGAGRRGASGAELDTAIRQIVSDAMTAEGVIDIYAEAGLSKPDISIIDDEFLRRFPTAANKNLQIEALRRLLDDEIRVQARRNVVTGRAFSEMLDEAIRRYQNHTIDAAQVVAELVDLARALQAQQRRGADLGLSDAELAFYDAIRTNDAAVIELGDDTLKRIAHDLVDIVRRDAKTDWAVKEQVRAKLRAAVRRLLLRYGYPPDQQEEATVLVLRQAEVLAGEAAA